MKKEKTKSGFSRLLIDLSRLRGRLLIILLLALVIIACNALSPRLIGWIFGEIESFTKTGGKGGEFLRKLTPALLLLAGVYLVYALSSWGKSMLFNYTVSVRISGEKRILLTDKISRLPLSYLDKQTVGEMVTRVNNNAGSMGGYVQEAMDVFLMGGLQMLVMAVMLLLENPWIGLLVLCISPLSLLVSVAISNKSGKYYDKLWGKNYEEVNSCVQECYAGFATTKNFQMKESFVQRHNERCEETYRLSERANFLSSLISPLVSLVNHLSFIVVCLLGGYFAVQGKISLASVITIILYSKNFSAPLEQIAWGFSSALKVNSSAKKVYDFLDLPEMEQEEGFFEKPAKGDVAFEGVDFSYDADKPLIEGLNLSVSAGQKIAIVGPTGGGKTTLVNLLMRFYDPQNGKILLDGEDICRLEKGSVREQFAMVLQDTWLFEGTVAENVAYGKEGASKEEVIEACKTAYADGFIELLPQGYDTPIKNTSLSGGQKQLLTIARAFLANKPLLILDEATSDVDSRTEVYVQKAMRKLMEGKTCFVIAHRLSTIVSADWIVAIDHGKIVDQGTHEGLLAKGGFYKTLWESQYSNENG